MEDLGTRWESETGTPLPLGGLVARKNLSSTTIATVQSVVHSSLQYARESPEAALPTMRLHAQEFDDSVLMQHVDLYVNDWTMDLGTQGQRALEEVSRRARAIGLTNSLTPDLQVFRG